MNKKLLNWIFVGQLILFGLIITGVLPRAVVPYLAGALAIYVLLSSLEDATFFFVRSIPFFLAIPITATFDNFNTCRILSTIIFLKWVWPKIRNPKSEILNKFKIKNSKTSLILAGLLLFAILSVVPAQDKILAIRRVI